MVLGAIILETKLLLWVRIRALRTWWRSIRPQNFIQVAIKRFLFCIKVNKWWILVMNTLKIWKDFDPFEVRITRMFYSCSIDSTTNVPKLNFLKRKFGKSWFSCIKFFTRSRIFTIFGRPLWTALIGPVIFDFFAVERFQWVWVGLLRIAISFDPLVSLPEG